MINCTISYLRLGTPPIYHILEKCTANLYVDTWSCLHICPSLAYYGESYFAQQSAPVFGWLLCVNSLTGGPLRSQCIFYSIFFFPSNLSPPTIGRRPPTHSNPRAPPLQHPFYCGCQLLVDCCVLLINGGQLRPMHHFPLYFLMWFILVSQMGTNQHGER